MERLEPNEGLPTKIREFLNTAQSSKSSESAPAAEARQKPEIKKLEGIKTLTGRIQDFIPEIASANAALKQSDVKPEDYDDDDDEGHVVMDVSLGVFDTELHGNDSSIAQFCSERGITIANVDGDSLEGSSPSNALVTELSSDDEEVSSDDEETNV